MAMLLFRGAPFGFQFIKKDLLLFIDRGKWVLGSSFLISTAKVADKVLFGLLLPDTLFGLYFIATQFSTMIPQLLSKLSVKLGIPMFRHLQEGSVTSFRSGYFKFRLMLDTLALVSCGMLLVLAPLVVEVIYDDRYAQVADFLQILAFGSIFSGPVLLRKAFAAQRIFSLKHFARCCAPASYGAVSVLAFCTSTVSRWRCASLRCSKDPRRSFLL